MTDLTITALTAATVAELATPITGGRLAERFAQADHGLTSSQPILADDIVAWEEVVGVMTDAWMAMYFAGAQQGVASGDLCKAVVNQIGSDCGANYITTVVLAEDMDSYQMGSIWAAVDRLAEEQYGDVLLGRIGNRATYICRA